MDVLDKHEAGHHVDAEQIRPFLRDGFPWHTPDVAHPELNTREAWWDRVGQLLASAYEGVGISTDRARVLGRLAAEHYVDTKHWRLYADALPALSALQRDGWRHIIVSNHVPELDSIVDDLGLGDLIEHTINSAVTGFEKPHPEAFALARRAAGDPSVLRMIGDNPRADVEGAEAVGIRGILIDRTGTEDRAARTARSLEEVAKWL
jgi:putative hydrolase of the HAD superfamily